MKIDVPEPIALTQQIPPWVDLLIYGLSGTGKTEFAAQFEPPVLILDSDKGKLTLSSSVRIPQTQKAQLYPLDIVDKSPDPHVKGPAGWLTARAIMETVSNTGEYFGIVPKTIVVDSLTTMSEFCMNYVLSVNGKAKNAQPSLPDYQRQMKELMDMIHYGVAAPCNFICIAHQQFVKDELSGKIWCLPLVTGKLAQNLPAYFDEVYYATVRESSGKHTFQLRTKPDGTIVAKSRLDLDSVIPADASVITNRITALRQAANSAAQSAMQKGGATGQANAAQVLGIK